MYFKTALSVSKILIILNNFFLHFINGITVLKTFDFTSFKSIFIEKTIWSENKGICL